jgi:hypothetical protein
VAAAVMMRFCVAVAVPFEPARFMYLTHALKAVAEAPGLPFQSWLNAAAPIALRWARHSLPIAAADGGATVARFALRSAPPGRCAAKDTAAPSVSKAAAASANDLKARNT